MIRRWPQVQWRLLTTHDVGDAAMVWRVVEWYRPRWTIEQLFRVLKRHRLLLEDSQFTTAEGLFKLTARGMRHAATGASA